MTAPGRLTAVLLASLLLAGATLAEPSKAVARRGKPTIISHQLVLKPDTRRLFLCQDEIDQFTVHAYDAYVYRNPGDSRTTRRHGQREPAGPVRVQATSTDARVASVSPPFDDLTASAFTGIYQVTAGELGSATIRITDTLNAATPVDVQVVTLECVIKVASTSNWAMNFNYPLDAYGTMPEATLKRVRDNHYEGTGTMAGFASAASIGGCIPRYVVSDTRVTLKADIQGPMGNQVIMLWIEYDTLTVRIPVQCLVVGGAGKGEGTPGSFSFPVPAFKQAPKVVTKNHNVMTELGPQPGVTQYVIRTEEVVPPPP